MVRIAKTVAGILILVAAFAAISLMLVSVSTNILFATSPVEPGAVFAAIMTVVWCMLGYVALVLAICPAIFPTFSARVRRRFLTR